MYSITTEIADVQGFLWLTAYLHYFTPGSLKLETKIRRVPLYPTPDFEDEAYGPLETRRWLDAGQGPYPGYCMAPGTIKCLPVLCDCEYLLQQWEIKWNVTENGKAKSRSKLELLYRPGKTNKLPE